MERTENREQRKPPPPAPLKSALLFGNPLSDWFAAIVWLGSVAQQEERASTTSGQRKEIICLVWGATCGRLPTMLD